MANISDWSENEKENLKLDEYSLSDPGKRPLAKIMAAVKAGFSSAPDPASKDSRAVAPTAWIVDEMRKAVELASGGTETVLYDRWGNPHVMCILPKFDVGDIDASLGTGVHPAFQYEDADGVLRTVPEIFIGKYLASNDGRGRPVTLPRRAPWTWKWANDITTIPDGPHKLCRMLNAGYGGSETAGWLGDFHFSLCTLATYAARLLVQYKTLGADGAAALGGNTNGGKDYSKPWQAGTLVEEGGGTTLTGSGPAAWSDDGIGHGLCDLIGNAQEAVYDAMTVKGQLRIVPYNNAVKRGVLNTASGPRRYIKEDGTYGTPQSTDVSTRISGGICYDGDGEGGLCINNTVENQSASADVNFTADFSGLEAASGVTVPAIMQILCLAPISGFSQPGQIALNNGTGSFQRCLTFGGSYASGAGAGLNCMSSVPYNAPGAGTGFRVMYM